jgi:hypothetical protein
MAIAAALATSTPTGPSASARPIAYLGRFSRPESLPSTTVPGSSPSLALAQITRVTAVCTAIMLEVNPTASATSRVRPAPEP